MAARRPHKTTVQSIPLRLIGARATPLALLLLALTLMAFHKMNMLPVAHMRTAVTDVFAPVMSAVTAPFATLTESFEGVRTLRALKAENIRLREENARLTGWYEAALKLQAENKSLHELLNVKADADLTYVTARVVSDPGGSFVRSVLLPAGRADGVVKGSAVMAGQGLVGRIMETGRHSARVLLVTDLNSRIPVLIQNTRTRAILAGRNEGMLYLERYPMDSSIAVGSRVVTSGDGGQLPADIPVGTVVSVGRDGVRVKPLADIDSLRHVQVVNARIDASLVTGNIVSGHVDTAP